MIFMVVMFIAWTVGLCSTLVLALIVVRGLFEKGEQTAQCQPRGLRGIRPRDALRAHLARSFAANTRTAPRCGKKRNDRCDVGQAGTAFCHRPTSRRLGARRDSPAGSHLLGSIPPYSSTTR